ncbi:hypothetical protein [Caballeronia sp. GaOx3]|uniref:hypothetical protein n=1 Tax=Caballeronia sp. GaOx3 TaxID=2921740 RepID=UPI0020282EA4|nr:hypothetical protein [Caballeronia sp. GaOx3]
MQMNAAPGTLSVALAYLFIGIALKRIGDNAKNIDEFLLFVVNGRDVRHLPLDELEREASAD